MCGRLCVRVLLVPKESVGGGAPVGDVIEEDLQFIVIVKVCCDNGANRGRHGELLRRDVLKDNRRTISTM